MPLLTELVSSEGGICYIHGAPNGALAGFIPLKIAKGVPLSRKLVPRCAGSRYAEKRQGPAALQDADAFFGTLIVPQGFGVRLSSAAFISLISAGNHKCATEAVSERTANRQWQMANRVPAKGGGGFCGGRVPGGARFRRIGSTDGNEVGRG
jgi:hypothetical protein